MIIYITIVYDLLYIIVNSIVIEDISWGLPVLWLPIQSLQSPFSENSSCLKIKMFTLQQIFQVPSFLSFVRRLFAGNSKQVSTPLMNILQTRNCGYLSQLIPCVSRVLMYSCHLALLQYQFLGNRHWTVADAIEIRNTIDAFTQPWYIYLSLTFLFHIGPMETYTDGHTMHASKVQIFSFSFTFFPADSRI